VRRPKGINHLDAHVREMPHLGGGKNCTLSSDGKESEGDYDDERGDDGACLRVKDGPYSHHVGGYWPDRGWL
jgi:hypothetical protein